MERQIITVDISPQKGIIPRLKVSQGDIGRPLGVNIIQDGVALDCSAYTADLYVLKSDGNYFVSTVTVDSTETNLIKWNTAEQETIVSGECAAQIRITHGEEDIGTARFVEYVEASPGFNGAGSESAVESIKEYVRQAAASAETASSAATSASTSATTATGAASSATSSATAAAGSASSAHTDAETASQAAQTAQDVAASIPEDYSQLSADVTGLKSAIDVIEDRMAPIDGIITMPPFENGSVYANNGAIEYSDNSRRIRMQRGTSLHLMLRDIIHIDTSYKVGINYSTDGGETYVWYGFGVGNYEAPYTGEYVLFIEQTTAVTDVKETESHVWIERSNNLVSDFDHVKNETNDLTNVEIDLFDGYYSSSGTVTEDASENACKYTQKIKCFDGMKLRVNLEYLTSSRSMWIATCEWKKNGTFVRNTVVSSAYRTYDFDYIPSNDINEVAITFRSFNDCEFTVQSLTGIFAIYETLSDSANKNQPPINYAFSNHLIKGINHRGYNRTAPENTMPAFKLSVENGFSFVETDIRFTSDNVPVLLHDATVDRTSNGTGNIADMTFAQARQLDFGAWKSETYAGTKIPSFEEFIRFCRDTQIFPYIEISATYTTSQYDIMCEIVDKYNMTNAVTWISFTANNLKAITSRNPSARVCRIHGGAMTEQIASQADELKTGVNEVFISVDYNYINADTVTICANYDLPLETWTINTAELIANLPDYVSGGTSDVVNFETIKRAMAME